MVPSFFSGTDCSLEFRDWTQKTIERESMPYHSSTVTGEVKTLRQLALGVASICRHNPMCGLHGELTRETPCQHDNRESETSAKANNPSSLPHHAPQCSPARLLQALNPSQNVVGLHVETHHSEKKRPRRVSAPQNLGHLDLFHRWRTSLCKKKNGTDSKPKDGCPISSFHGHDQVSMAFHKKTSNMAL